MRTDITPWLNQAVTTSPSLHNEVGYWWPLVAGEIVGKLIYAHAATQERKQAKRGPRKKST
jgi:hypothetical protein